MNTVKKLEVPVSMIDELRICKLENGVSNLTSTTTINTVSKTLNSYDFDKTFYNIDAIELLLIDKIENPKSYIDVKTDVNRFKPHKTHEGQIKLTKGHGNDIKH